MFSHNMLSCFDNKQTTKKSPNPVPKFLAGRVGADEGDFSWGLLLCPVLWRRFCVRMATAQGSPARLTQDSLSLALQWQITYWH